MILIMNELISLLYTVNYATLIKLKNEHLILPIITNYTNMCQKFWYGKEKKFL